VGEILFGAWPLAARLGGMAITAAVLLARRLERG